MLKIKGRKKCLMQGKTASESVYRFFNLEKSLSTLFCYMLKCITFAYSKLSGNIAFYFKSSCEDKAQVMGMTATQGLYQKNYMSNLMRFSPDQMMSCLLLPCFIHWIYSTSNKFHITMLQKEQPETKTHWESASFYFMHSYKVMTGVYDKFREQQFPQFHPHLYPLKYFLIVPKLVLKLLNDTGNILVPTTR